MRVLAYTPLHYGKDYLKYAVESVAGIADRHIILYTPVPSYGHRTSLPCPDTEEELRACVEGFNHVEWYTGDWNSESAHRGTILSYRKDEDVILPVDADEVWDEFALMAAIDSAQELNLRDIRVRGFVHLWRSFKWGCMDELHPTRIVLPASPPGTQYVQGRVWHFGYAQTPDLMRYKWSCHGHQNELRKGWLDRYINWQPPQGDLHPTNVKFWDAKPIDRTWMPEFMHDHPYYDLELIT